MVDEQGQAPDEQAAPDDAGSGDQASSQEDGKRTTDELARARSEAAKYRTDLRASQARLKELEKKEQERTEAEKSELQRATDKAQALEAEVAKRDDRIKELRLAQEVSRVAAKMDIVDPEAAFTLLDKGAVQYEGDQPQNIDDLLTTLVEAKPYLKRTGRKAPEVSPTSPDSGKKKPLTRADVEKMTDDEVAARYDDVMAVLASEG